MRSSWRRPVGRWLTRLGVHYLDVYQGRTEIAHAIGAHASRTLPEAQRGSTADLIEIMANSDARTRARIETARRLDSECWVLRLDGALAGYTWIHRSVADLSPITTHPLKAGEAYQYLSYTFEPFRGRGVFQALIRTVAKQLAAEGFTVIVNYVDRDNAASIRARQRTGASLTRVVWLKLPGWRALPVHRPG